SNSGWSNMQVSYFVYGGTSAAWTSGPAAGQLSAGAIGFQSASPAKTVLGLYANPTSAQVAVLKSNLSSYFTNMDNSGSAPGSFGGFIPAGNGEQNMAALAQRGAGYVDQYLYYYSNPGTASAGLQVADIRTCSTVSPPHGLRTDKPVGNKKEAMKTHTRLNSSQQ